jgi:hypothetical protein
MGRERENNKEHHLFSDESESCQLTTARTPGYVKLPADSDDAAHSLHTIALHSDLLNQLCAQSAHRMYQTLSFLTFLHTGDIP